MEPMRSGRVENYTPAVLVMVFVNLLWIFGVIWASYGILPVILVGWALNEAIKWLEGYLASREIQWPRQSDA